MKTSQLPNEALEVLMKEHSAIREEIRDRLKTAFAHVAYAGAVAAFAVPLALQVNGTYGWIFALIVALTGLAALSWVALLNMRWVQHAGAYVRWIEHRIGQHFGEQILGWEHYSETVRASHFALIPAAPPSKVPGAVVSVQDSSL